MFVTRIREWKALRPSILHDEGKCNIDSLEASRRADSNEYLQYFFLATMVCWDRITIIQYLALTQIKIHC